MNKFICLIPARSGSKRVPNKNIKSFAGTSLLEHAVKRALNSNIFSSVVCCTDSESYADIAEKAGAHIPGLRPKSISSSFSPDFDWVNWASHEIKQFYGLSIFAILRPTSPFLSSTTINMACTALQKSNYESLRAVAECDQHPAKMWTLKGDLLQPILPYVLDNGIDMHSCQKASLPKVFVQTAGLDISKSIVLSKYRNISGATITPYFLTSPEDFDVNTPRDWSEMQKLSAEYLSKSLD